MDDDTEPRAAAGIDDSGGDGGEEQQEQPDELELEENTYFVEEQEVRARVLLSERVDERSTVKCA